MLDRNNYHGFWPLLYQVATGQIEAGQVAYPVRTALRRAKNVRFRRLDVERLDPERRLVLGRTGESVPYDHLILAPGSRTSYLGIEGAEAHSLPFKSLDHGLAIRNRILDRFERAVSATDAEERRALLTFAMVGAGPTGVELAGALAELVRGPFRRDYPTLDLSEVRILVLEALERPLPAFSERAARYTRKRLERLGVDVRLGTEVEALDPGRIRLADDTVIRAETVIWAAGVQGHPLLQRSGLPTTKKGTVRVDRFLRVAEHPSVLVAGDSAHFEEDEEPLPMVAQVAVQQARRAAENVLRAVRGRDPEPFSYTDLGMMAVIGRGRAVVQRKPVTVVGALAWPAWALVHIAKLVGFRSRLLVMINWAAAYLFSDPGVRLILPLERAEEAASSDGE